MTVYLVKRQHFTAGSESSDWQYDDVIAVCSTLEKARLYVDRPNFDIIITEYTVDDVDSEKLVENIWPVANQ